MLRRRVWVPKWPLRIRGPDRDTVNRYDGRGGGPGRS